ncbi:MAG: amino acid ABC transporter permease [Burkholderiales bacterium]|nr:amino acid ABC transporter permease [Burkholderiales bacterium]
MDFGFLLTAEYRDAIVAGLVVTLELSALAAIIAAVLGIILAVARMAPFAPARWLSAAYIEFIRNTPLLVQLLFWYFGAPQLLPQVWLEWLYDRNFEFAAGLAGLACYTAAFVAEDVRSGIRNVARGQMEAARACGLGYLGAMRLVILPQALRTMVPALVNQLLNLTKNSSLAMAIGVAELMYQVREVESRTFRTFEAFAAATAIYLALSLVITLFAAWRERGRPQPHARHPA